MNEMEITIHTTAERPELADEIDRVSHPLWPEFMHHDPVASRHWGRLSAHFAEFQIALCDSGQLIAAGHAIPMAWDGTEDGIPEGWDDAFEKAICDHAAGVPPTALLGLAAVVVPSSRSKGISRRVIDAMKAVASSYGLRGPLLPVRPTMKAVYPLTPMEKYMRWTRDDGLPLDPWIRTHWRMGARIIRAAPRSMVITSTIAEWEQWTGMRFPESGPYVVPGALSPVEMDRGRNTGTYIEPNVWMLHDGADGREQLDG